MCCSLLSVGVAVLAVYAGVLMLQELPPDTVESPQVRDLNALLLEGLYKHWTTNATGDVGVIHELAQSQTLVGKTCLVTGASRGLGYWIAARLSSLGCAVVVASRSGSEDLADNIAADAKRLEPAVASIGPVRPLKMDLADLNSIEEGLNSLRTARVQFDVAILNAGIAPSKGWKTKHGFEAALGTNCIGNAHLMEQLLVKRLIADQPRDTQNGDFPRLVIVSSESHRTVPPLNLTDFREFHDFGMSEGMVYYGRSKLCLNTYMTEFGRRNQDRLAVHGLCPGPVQSSIASDAPSYLQPFIDVFMSTFQPAVKAATPVVALAASSQYSGENGVYQHMDDRVPVRADAADPEKGAAVYSTVQSMISEALNA